MDARSCCSLPIRRPNGGPKGIPECEQPINQLYHDLSKGRAFPTCGMSDGNDGSSYAAQVYDPYDACPTPLRAAARGSYVARGERNASGGSAGCWGDTGSFVLSG
jgi:hypothetical protein